MGGMGSNNGYLDSVEYFHPDDGSWQTSAAKLPSPAMNLRATNIDDRILIFGGFGSERSSRSRNNNLSVCPSMSECSRALYLHLSGSESYQSEP